MMQELVVSYEDSRAAAQSDDPTDLAWLREFLSPSFHFGAPVAPCRFVLRSDPRAVEEGRRMSLGTREQITAFIQDSGVENLPCRRGSGHEVMAYDKIFDAVYHRTAQTTVLDTPSAGPGRRARGALMRAVRERVMDEVWLTGGSIFHAAAFAVEGRAILVAGDKEAGKTSMLSAALLDIGTAAFLSNDRVTLRRSGGELRARALPSIVSIRAGSLGVVPGLAARLAGIAHDYTGTPVSPESLALRRLLAPWQMADALEVSMRGEAAVCCILFPLIDPQEPAFRLRRLTEEESSRRVLRSAFAKQSLGRRTELFAAAEHGRVFPGVDPLEERLAAATAGTACFEVAIGPGLYARDGMRRLIDTVLASAI